LENALQLQVIEFNEAPNLEPLEYAPSPRKVSLQHQKLGNCSRIDTRRADVVLCPDLWRLPNGKINVFGHVLREVESLLLQGGVLQAYGLEEV
jgi:hypothetical protein